jgi:pimeloyl-ACP methyl ester carboxylesterase
MQKTRPMRNILVPLIAALVLLPARPATAALDAAAAVGTPTTVIPATPAGDQLTWVLAQLNGGAAALSETELSTHFAPTFLAEFPVPLLGLLRQTAADYAPITFAGFPFPPTATGAVAEVDLATGEHAAIYVTVEPGPPHRITRLDLAEAPPPPSATGRRVALDGRALYLDCIGRGGPTVVLEGGVVPDWAAVQPEVAATARVCGYDRPDSPGSRSDPTPERTAQEVVDDMFGMLAASGEPGPYLLVGHSMGGLYVQLFAHQHPGDVAGLVLVAPTPEQFSSRLRELLTALGTPVPEWSAESPPTAQEISFAQMRAARATSTFPPTPLVVLTHGRADDPNERPPGWPLAEEERIWRELHEEIARLAPNGRHVVAAKSGHDIQQEQPELVIEAIRCVVAAVRAPITWATPTANLATPNAFNGAILDPAPDQPRRPRPAPDNRV